MNVESRLIIGGITVNFYAALDWSQSYAPIGGATVHRKLNGSASKQAHWRKWKTRISAQGNIPPGLDGVDWNAPQTMACAAQMSQAGAGLVYALPAARRSDAGFTPEGWAYLGVDRGWVPTALALAGNTATLTAVSGAMAYRAKWYPLLTVFSDGPEEEQDLMTGEWSWSLDAEEA